MDIVITKISTTSYRIVDLHSNRSCVTVEACYVSRITLLDYRSNVIRRIDDLNKQLKARQLTLHQYMQMLHQPRIHQVIVFLN